jgi:soluble lytic murein transglycosylase-like protein
MRQPVGTLWTLLLITNLASAALGADSSQHPFVAVSLTKSTTEKPGAASGLVELAAKYEHGEAVPRDYQRALVLYCEAARLGNPTAFFNLGWMYLNGRGIPRNDAVAVGWLKQAADHGVAQAVNLLTLLRNAAPATDPGCGSSPKSRVAVTTASARVRALVERTAKEVGIDAGLVMAVIAAESAFDPRAVSRRDAQGLMQLMPDTAARFGVKDPFDEEANVRAGATYLRILLERFEGDLSLALAAYNAGVAAVDSYGGIPPYRETKEYVERVKRLCACSGG